MRATFARNPVYKGDAPTADAQRETLLKVLRTIRNAKVDFLEIVFLFAETAEKDPFNEKASAFRRELVDWADLCTKIGRAAKKHSRSVRAVLASIEQRLQGERMQAAAEGRGSQSATLKQLLGTEQWRALAKTQDQYERQALTLGKRIAETFEDFKSDWTNRSARRGRESETSGGFVYWLVEEVGVRSVDVALLRAALRNRSRDPGKISNDDFDRLLRTLKGFRNDSARASTTPRPRRKQRPQARPSEEVMAKTAIETFFCLPVTVKTSDTDWVSDALKAHRRQLAVSRTE